MIRRPPRSTRTDTLFPYTTLFRSGMVVNPITIGPGRPLAYAQALMARHKISGIPVVENDGKLVGILTHRNVRFAEKPKQPVLELMTPHNLSNLPPRVRQEYARHPLPPRRIQPQLVCYRHFHYISF